MAVGIVNDVESLKKFRGELLDTSDDLKEQLNRTESAIEEVAESWGDSQFVKFKEGFEQDKDVIKPLCDEIEDFEYDVLLPLENTLRKYLDL